MGATVLDGLAAQGIQVWLDESDKLRMRAPEGQAVVARLTVQAQAAAIREALAGDPYDLDERAGILIDSGFDEGLALSAARQQRALRRCHPSLGVAAALVFAAFPEATLDSISRKENGQWNSTNCSSSAT